MGFYEINFRNRVSFKNNKVNNMIKIKNFSIYFCIILSSLFISNITYAQLDDNDREDARNIVTTPKADEYITLWKDSHAHARKNFYNNLSTVAKVGAVLASSVSGLLNFFLDSNTEDTVSGSLAVASLICVTFDGLWFSKLNNYYAEAPRRLQEFLDKEASSFMGSKNIDQRYKHEILYIIDSSFKAERLRRAGSRAPLTS